MNTCLPRQAGTSLPDGESGAEWMAEYAVISRSGRLATRSRKTIFDEPYMIKT